MFKSIIYLLFVLLIICVEEFYPQISPGELTKAHANLEGLSNCTKCHQLGEQILNSKCLDCHSEIKELMNLNRGYHSSSDVRNKDCWSCHSEHHGRNFRIINFNPDNFNHDKTGFILTGSHKSIDCSKCHNSSFITDSKLKKKNKTFLGLTEKCQNCHEDYHQTTLGNDCTSCHNTEKFKPLKNFDHNKTNFRLTGRHDTVECISCHTMEKKNGKDFQRFKGLSFANCSSCHNDVHKGVFGADCKSCHSTNGFNVINQSAFNHSLTKFPLVGKHQQVGCNDCHKSGISVKPAFAMCINCHSDYHKGDFVVNGINRECKECHTEQGFSPSNFSIEEHNKLNFKLTGSHLAVPCKSCHGKNDAWHFKSIGKNCIDCHNNVHGSELTAEYLPENNCSYCHITDNWNTINFKHDLTAFKLLGKHKSVSCNQCHVQIDSSGKLSYRFASLKSDCVVCHNDIHYGQFIINQKNECSRCHTFDDWKPEKFNHNETKFSLAGAHSKLECSKCHKETVINGNKFIVFKLEDFRCASCHS